MDTNIDRKTHPEVISISRVGDVRCSTAVVANVAATPRATPSATNSRASANISVQTSIREEPSALRMPISLLRSSTMVYIVSKTTRKLMTIPKPMKDRMNGFSSGKLEEVISDMYSAMER